jgi:hypothetical protein
MAYTGRWRAQSLVRYSNPPTLSGTVPDPEHRDPTANPNDQRTSWSTDGGRFQYFPEDLQGDGAAVAGVGPTRGGAVLDREPAEHSYGVGYGAGLTEEQSVAANNAARSTDLGSVPARRYSAPQRQDGTYTAALLQEPVYPVGSPDSVVEDMTADPRTSPNASVRGPGKRVFRIWHRTFGRNDWMGRNDHRPLYTTTAFTAPGGAAAGPVPSGSQYTSPYPTAAGGTVRNVTAVAPQLRRSPRPWDEGITTDGSTPEVQLDPGYFSGGL